VGAFIGVAIGKTLVPALDPMGNNLGEGGNILQALFNEFLLSAIFTGSCILTNNEDEGISVKSKEGLILALQVVHDYLHAVGVEKGMNLERLYRDVCRPENFSVANVEIPISVREYVVTIK
jgi:hypothetical protein